MKKKHSSNVPTQGNIVIYRTKDGSADLKVTLQRDTLWLTQKQLADLFKTDRSVITKHLNSVFRSGELPQESNVQKMHIAHSDKPVKQYSLDAVISVGYRVNSSRATQFRIWATKTLKNYVLRGYALNRKRLEEQTGKLQELQRAIGFIKDKAVRPELEGQTHELFRIIDEYAKSLTLLHEYDQGTLKTIPADKPTFALTYENSRTLIRQIKTRLIEKREAGDLFGNETDHKFKSTIGTIYQTFDGCELYPTVADKAAHLLYLTIKDHPFSDGNKRIGSMLFIYFLDNNHELSKNAGERKLNENALVALALLIAESDPKEKDVMIKIITNLIA